MPRFTSAEVRSVLTSALDEEPPGDGESAANYFRRIVRLLKARHKSSIRMDTFTRAWFKKLVKEHYPSQPISLQTNIVRVKRGRQHLWNFCVDSRT